MSRVLKKTKIDKSYKLVKVLDDNFQIDFKITFSREPNVREMRFLEILLKEFNITKKSSNRFFLDARGNCKDIKRLFNTEISLLRQDKKEYFCETKDIEIPQGYDFILGIIGLNNCPRFKSYSKTSSIKSIDTSFTPIQVGEFYDFPFQSRGSNRLIALIELDGGYRTQDLKYYFIDYLKLGRLPVVYPIVMDGAKNNPDSPFSQEVVLNIEIAAAIAKCAITLVYFAPNSELGYYDAVYFALTNQSYMPPCAISTSWGTPEVSNTQTFMDSMNLLFDYGRKRRINIFAASGNFGSSGGLPGLNVDFPASSPYVIGCGGTSMIVKNNKLIDEVVWSGSGGGFSKIFPKPEYQKDIQSDTRGVPDVAGSADPDKGYIIYRNGKFESVGGTSAVAPLYAGLTALMSSTKGSVPFLNDKMYPIAEEVCFDIIKGSNGPDGKYDATIGWDPCTGNGRIYGDKLLASLYT